MWQGGEGLDGESGRLDVGEVECAQPWEAGEAVQSAGGEPTRVEGKALQLGEWRHGGEARVLGFGRRFCPAIREQLGKARGMMLEGMKIRMVQQIRMTK